MILLVITMTVMKMDGKFSKNRNQMIDRDQQTGHRPDTEFNLGLQADRLR